MSREAVVNLLSNELKSHLKKEDIEKLLEIPPSSELGDYAFPCFSLAKIFKKNPIEIAKDLANKLKPSKDIEKIQATGAYINFFINPVYFADQVLKIKESYGKSKATKEKIMVEFASPNTNKPLHLGHLRNMSIGESISRVLELNGKKVIRANLNNDRGVHICKSMLSYKLFGKGKTPSSEKIKSDHFIGDYYVMFSQKSKENPQLEQEAQGMLVKWEAGDKEVRSLWKKMNTWALDGFKETYSLFGIKFDKEYYESEIYDKAREIVDLGLKKKVFTKREDGAVIINLEKENLGEKVILRADGTSIYITQDLYLAKLKDEEFKLDGSIYVVANEQNYHFQVLLAVLKKLGFSFSDNLHHLSYGMVNLPEGRMKSREGTVVDADDLIQETQNLARKELESRYKLSKSELESRSLKIALAAIKYSLLKIDIAKDMIFNPNEAISFEGDTGPYLQYSYARASSILKKSLESKKLKNNKVTKLEVSEIALIKELLAFPQKVEESSLHLSPHIIANYTFSLAQKFSDFYHNCPVIGSENASFRLDLVRKFRLVMSSSLSLLGIDVIEEM
jgi:arginyl-tRNA synthetase